MKDVEKIKPTGLFTNYIFKAIPLAFDESLSYYECLCGLLSYLKETVIPTVNNNADAIIEVQNLMTQLQNYVDNYFNNLNVQNEINNKLDEMVNDGTLDSIINNTLFTNINNEIDSLNKNLNTLQSNILNTTPQEAFESLDDLIAKYPNGSKGIYVVKNNNSWYFYNGTNWEEGGNYNQSVPTFPLNVNTNYNDFTVLTKKADEQFYIPNQLYPCGYVNYIKLKTLNSGNNGELYILYKNNNKLFCYKKYDFISVNGEVNININEYFKQEFFIGVKCTSLAYGDVDNTYYSYKNGFDINNTYNLNRLLTGYGFGINCNMNLYYKNIYKENNVELLNVIQKNSTTFPITFDFPNNKIIIDCFIINYNEFNKVIDIKTINQELQLEPYDTYNNYYLFYNKENQNFTCIKDNNSYIDTNTNYLICSFYIDNHNTTFEYPPKLLIHNFNNNIVNVILQNANEDEKKSLIKNNIYNTVNNEYYAKRYKALGDSITRGENPNNNYQPMLNYRYTDIVAKTTGLNAINYGVGGSRITPGNDRNDSFWERRNVGGSELYSIMGGVNDYKANVEIGDVDNQNINEFSYAFDSLISYFLGAGKQLFVITPMHCENDNKPNTKGYTLKDYVDCEIKICNKYGVPILNLYDNFELNPNIQVMKTKYLPDGLHPNIDGMKILGNRISSYIKLLLNI